MSVVNLITIVEADGFLAAYPDWLSLTDAEKNSHIFTASLYTQSVWECVSVDWEDPSTLNDDQKQAVAYYALADSLGTLFGSVSDGATESLKRKLVKAGSVTVEKEYGFGSEKSGNTGYLGYPDTLMNLSCNKRTSSQKVVRV